MTDRRAFMKKAGLALGTIPLANLSKFGYAKNLASEHPICYFTKHLQWLDFDDLGIALKEAGFDGADLTVRQGGHIKPDAAATNLPKAVSTLQKHGISVPMVVTKVSSPDEKGLSDFLSAMSDNGILYYRMGYLDYNHDISIQKNIDSFHAVLSRLADLNAKHNICGVYQNHAGTRLGGSIWDLLLALKGIDPNHLGCQFDVRHATFEGGRSWENDFRAISDHVRTTVVKDFHWKLNSKGQWTNNNTLMGKGMVDFEKYFKLYRELGLKGPISNHSEYPLLTKEESKLSKTEKMDIAIGRLRQDVDFTNEFLNKIGLN